MPSSPIHEIIVGNIGTVYSGDSHAEAQVAYIEYCRQSTAGRGRADGESVCWMKDGEIHKEI
jgi:hypothetical protein